MTSSDQNREDSQSHLGRILEINNGIQKRYRRDLAEWERRETEGLQKNRDFRKRFNIPEDQPCCYGLNITAPPLKITIDPYW